MLRALPFLSVVMFGCVACTVLSSKTIEDLAEADRKPSGTFYSLPLGVAEFELSVVPQKATFTLSLVRVNYVPDPAHRYYLQYRPLPNYDDVIDVKTDNRSFLTSVSAITTDQTPNIVVNVVKALTVLGALEAATLPEDSQTLAKITIDPTDAVERENAIKAFNAKIEAYVNTAREACSYFDGTVEPDKITDAACKAIPPPAKSDSALIANECKRRPLYAALNDAKANKQYVDAQLAAYLQTVRDQDAADLKCSTTKGSEHALCKLLDRQDKADKQLKKATAQHDELVTKINDINSRRRDQAGYCGRYKKFFAHPPRARMRVYDYRDAVLEQVDEADPPAHPWHGVLHRAQDCSAGICYRPKEPYKVVFGIETEDGVAIDTAIVELPNQAMPILIDIRRAFFVKKVQEMQFDKDGFLTNVHINKPSELLAVSKLPLDILDAIATGFRIRVDLLNKQRDIARKEAALIDAQTKLYGTRTRLESASTKSESALESAPARQIRGGASSW